VGSAFKAFADNTTSGRCVKALRISGAGNAQRSFFDQLESIAKDLGAKGLAYVSSREDGLKSPILKFLSDEEIQGLKSQLHLEVGDAVILCAGEWLATCKVMGQLRKHLANQLNLIPENVLALCWVVDFPMYEWNEQEHKIDFSHNPFSMPQGGLDALTTQDPLTVLAYQYDLVCNGVELSSGAIRNHQPEVMYRAFEIVGYSRADVDAKFGHMIKAFMYGAPPHGGIAPGVDRIVMILANAVNIREVIMFPMNQSAQELMVGSPSEVTPHQLKELHLAILP
jgi:aspartyl-tRNA synthetase